MYKNNKKGQGFLTVLLTIFIMIIITFLLIGAIDAVIVEIIGEASNDIDKFLIRGIPFALLLGLARFAFTRGVGG